MNDKPVQVCITIGKWHTRHRLAKQKVSFVLVQQQKISKRCPWKTEFFCIFYFSKIKCKLTNSITMLFMSKEVSLPKISLILKK